MINVVITGIIIVVIGTAVIYIRKQKKKGVRCIGCPDGRTCSRNCAGDSSSNDKKE